MKKEQSTGGDIVPLPRHSENFKVNRMLSYIEKHWNSTIELEELASWAGSSPCYASALFSRTMCMTFIQYLNALRVNKASKLLVDSNMSINDISDFCGFQNSSYFIHIFHSLSGSTPGEYRKRKKCKLVYSVYLDSFNEGGINEFVDSIIDGE